MAEEVKELSVFPMGEENPFGQYFTGKSYRKALSSEQVKVSNITFTPGCRNHWHIRELKPGDVVNIPANVKHWHGAAKDSWFQHIGIGVPGTKTSTEWCEPVSDDDYAKLP